MWYCGNDDQRCEKLVHKQSKQIFFNARLVIHWTTINYTKTKNEVTCVTSNCKILYLHAVRSSANTRNWTLRMKFYTIQWITTTHAYTVYTHNIQNTFELIYLSRNSVCGSNAKEHRVISLRIRNLHKKYTKLSNVRHARTRAHTLRRT